MFALYKTAEYLVCKLSIHYKFSLGHKGDITLLRFLQDLAFFRESAEVKYNRWSTNIKSNIDFHRKTLNSLKYVRKSIPYLIK